MCNPCKISVISDLRQRSPCLNNACDGWKDTRGYISRKVKLKTDTEGKLSKEKEIEMQSDLKIESFSKELLFRAIKSFIHSPAIKQDFRENLEGLKDALKIFDNNLADIVGTKIKGHQITTVPGEKNGKNCKDVFVNAINETVSNISDHYNPSIINELNKISAYFNQLPDEFFSVLIQLRCEAHQDLPSEDSFFIDPALIEQHPKKYQIHRFGIKAAQCAFGLALIFVGSYSMTERTFIQLDEGDSSGLFNYLLGTAMSRFNMTKTEAVDRILSDPEFVAFMGGGVEPHMDGVSLAHLGGGEKVIIMSIIALANRLNITEYIGMGMAVFCAKAVNAVNSVLESAYSNCCRCDRY